ncbi:biotin--[acetyl-CoA-carboxylase] ligase [Asanoa sp. NPDC050611]|uniref:biotin--[acetyl-CoA-carboxylase] ligase n=1 Tax=Asanoa sp. NPDC050611 TaxID=3157098 RepID=UPI0033DEE212
MPGSPYTDLDRPPLNARALERALTGPGELWNKIDLRSETASTNADVAEAARSGAPEGLVEIAERQTAGRGRLGRTWISPARAGIAVSVLLRPGAGDTERGWPPLPTSAYAWLPLLAGVALAEAVIRLAELPDGLVPELKWPNDLLLDGAKCAGILAEGVPDGAGGPAVVIGIGLNVTLRADELPASPTGLPATSLRLAGAEVTDRDPLVRATLRGISTWYDRWRAAGGDAAASGLRGAYLSRCGTIGRDVRVVLPGNAEFTGTATGVDDSGRLVVRTPEGDRTVAAGDVVHLR